MRDQTHLTLRGTTYWFRCRVPSDLVEPYGKREVTFSLRTKDKKEAISKARVEAVRLTQEFSHKRSLIAAQPLQKLTQQEIERLAALWASEVLADDEQRRIDKTIDDAYREGAEEGLTHFAEALADSDYTLLDSFLPGYLEGKGIKLRKDSDPYRSLAYSILKEGIRVHDMIRQRERGLPIDTPKTEEIGIRTDLPEDTLEALRDYWLTQPAKKGGKKSRTAISEANTMIRKFGEMVGDIRPSQVEKKHVVLLKDKMLEAGSAPATINKGRGILAAIFSCAYENQKISRNPFDGMKKLPVPQSEQEKPYTVEELQTIFNSPIFTKDARPVQGKGEAAFWLPLLGLYTGARLNELGQLFVDDVGEENGIPFLMIRPHSATNRTVKDKSRRRIPIHLDLIAMGFLDYAKKTKEAKATQLFPLLKVTRAGGKLGDKWGDWWRNYVRTHLGITRIPQPFHGLRHSFSEFGRRSGMDYEHRMRIEGHSMNTVGDRSYGASLFPLEPLHQSIKMLSFQGLDLRHLMAHPVANSA